MSAFSMVDHFSFRGKSSIMGMVSIWPILLRYQWRASYERRLWFILLLALVLALATLGIAQAQDKSLYCSATT